MAPAEVQTQTRTQADSISIECDFGWPGRYVLGNVSYGNPFSQSRARLPGLSRLVRPGGFWCLNSAQSQRLVRFLAAGVGDVRMGG